MSWGFIVLLAMFEQCHGGGHQKWAPFNLVRLSSLISLIGQLYCYLYTKVLFTYSVAFGNVVCRSSHHNKNCVVIEAEPVRPRTVTMTNITVCRAKHLHMKHRQTLQRLYNTHILTKQVTERIIFSVKKP